MISMRPLERDMSSLHLGDREASEAWRNILAPHPRAPRPPCLGPAPTSKRQGAAPSLLPHGMGNAALTYSSSASASLSAYAELPRHHLCSTLDLIMTPLASA